MANSVLLGKYYAVDSVIHRLNVKVKIVSSVLFLTSLFLITNIVYMAYTLIPIIILALLSKVKFKMLINSIKPMRVLIIFMFVFNIFFIKTGNLVFEYKFIEIYDKALYNSSFFILRLILMILYTSLLTLTTKPIDLSDGIESLLKPLQKIKVPAHEIGMMISISLRFIPTLFDETDKIMKAQASRGIDYKNGKIKEKIQGLVALLVPLFISSIKRAEDLANAMEIRGYVGGEGRTCMIDSKIGKNEIIYFTFHVITVIIFVSIRIGR